MGLLPDLVPFACVSIDKLYGGVNPAEGQWDGVEPVSSGQLTQGRNASPKPWRFEPGAGYETPFEVTAASLPFRLTSAGGHLGCDL
jgi:hypothetical protein